MVYVKRFAAILLLGTFIALGTGAMQTVHELIHAEHGSTASETSCDLHGQLHVPIMSAGYVPLLVCLGLFVAFISLISPPLIPQRIFQRIDCRGPPTC